MIVTKEFIWNKDHFICHITEEKNMLKIMEKGLIPLNGERCKFAMDKRKGIFCLDGIDNVEEWAISLYEQYELETLKLLRFNLKKRKWYIDNSHNTTFALYLPYKVLPQKISYLDIRDKNNIQLPLPKLFDFNLYKLESGFNNIENNKEVCLDEFRLI